MYDNSISGSENVSEKVKLTANHAYIQIHKMKEGENEEIKSAKEKEKHSIVT